MPSYQCPLFTDGFGPIFGFSIDDFPPISSPCNPPTVDRSANSDAAGNGVAQLQWPAEIGSPWMVNVSTVPAARPSRFRCGYPLLKLLNLRSQFHEHENSSAQTVKNLGAATHGPSQHGRQPSVPLVIMQWHRTQR
jgi:hypothetical protein